MYHIDVDLSVSMCVQVQLYLDVWHPTDRGDHRRLAVELINVLVDRVVVAAPIVGGLRQAPPRAPKRTQTGRGRPARGRI